MKKLTVLVFAVLMPFIFAAAVFADTGNTVDLKVNPYGGDCDAIDTVSVFRASSGQYYLFLPADIDLESAKVYFENMGDVTVDGKAIASGGSASALTSGVHTLSCRGGGYRLTVFISENVPSVFITTESGSLDYIHRSKENKEPGNIRIYENGEITIDKALKQIKGRGNSTWNLYPKKPYNIKFDKKTDVFSMGKAKKWTLLANYVDHSLVHNAYGFEFARAFGLPYTSEYRHIDLYINGNYLGNYLICESVEIGDNRIEINDLEKANEEANPDIDIEALPRGSTGSGLKIPNSKAKGSRKWIEIPENPADISGGYLLEYEYGSRYDQELCGFVTKNGQPVVIKSPEYASKDQVNYIADLVEAGTEALYSETGYNSGGSHYSDYFDMESLVNMYILQELTQNYDAAVSSFFIYKQQGESKLVFAPVWDMDFALGSTTKTLNGYPATDCWWANQMGNNGIPTILAAAYRRAEFRTAVKARWQELRNNGAVDNVNEYILSLSQSIAPSAAMNAKRWDQTKANSPSEVQVAYLATAQSNAEFVDIRASALDRGFGENGAYLYYDVNGATSGKWSLVSEIKEIGDTVTLRKHTGNGTIAPPGGKEFYCWNTEADGSGINYFPGDTMVLEKEENIVYAIWKTQQELDEMAAAEKLLADKAEFEEVKRTAVAKARNMAQSDDSDASKKLVSDAEGAISAMVFDESKSLADNIKTINAVLTSLDADLLAQRLAESKVDEKDSPDETEQPEEPPAPDEPDNTCKWCGKIHEGFWGRIAAFFHSILLKLFPR